MTLEAGKSASQPPSATARAPAAARMAPGSQGDLPSEGDAPAGADIGAAIKTPFALKQHQTDPRAVRHSTPPGALPQSERTPVSPPSVKFKAQSKFASLTGGPGPQGPAAQRLQAAIASSVRPKGLSSIQEGGVEPDATAEEEGDAADAFDAANSITSASASSSMAPSPSGSPSKMIRASQSSTTTTTVAASQPPPPLPAAPTSTATTSGGEDPERQKRKREEAGTPEDSRATSPAPTGGATATKKPPSTPKASTTKKGHDASLITTPTVPTTPVTLREQLQNRPLGYTGAPSMPPSALSSPSKRVFGEGSKFAGVKGGSWVPNAAADAGAAAGAAGAATADPSAGQLAFTKLLQTSVKPVADAKDEADGPDDSTAVFEPLVHLEKVENLKSGEEEEECVVSVRAKLFVLDTASSQWKERGIGQLKVLQQKDDAAKLRLLMRQEGMQKLILNMAANSCHLVQDQKILRLRGIDVAYPNEALEAGTFSIKTSSEKDAKEVREALSVQ